MKLYGLIGRTLSHSFSRTYFTSKFAALGLSDSCRYENFELESLHDFLPLVRKQIQLAGLNVTIPYKEQIVPYLDELSGAAKIIGAVNTIKITRDSHGAITHLTGFNTDGIGFLNALQPLLKPHHHGAIILGTGGASKAVEWALNSIQIPFMKISRTPNAGCLTYHELHREIIDSHPVIINTTPLGTFPEVNSCPPIPYEYLSERNLLFDLVYNPAETLFMKKGLEKNASVVNGLEMLKNQAEAAWQIWNTP